MPNKILQRESSGSKDGWSCEGIHVFVKLIEKVELLRANLESGILLEKKIKDRILGKKVSDMC